MHRMVCACVLFAAAADVKVPITSRSEEARTLYLQGRALAEQLRAHDAEALFEKAVGLDPTFAMAEYNLSLVAPTAKARLEHLNKAVALADHASEGERLLILSRQATYNADPAKALQYAETLVGHYPQDERARWVLGNAYLAQAVYDKAVAEYRKAIDINPQYSPAYNSLGYGYRATGNTADAEKAFQQYIALVPNDPNPYDSYAELLMAMGRFDASIAQYRKALSIDPHFGASHVGIAADHMFAGQQSAAIAEAKVYYDAARDDLERRIALGTQALIYVDEGATDSALHALDLEDGLARASSDTANMAADAVTAADVLLDAGRVDAARAKYQQARDLVAGSSLPADVKQDNALAWHYNMARVALEAHDLAAAQTEAAAYVSGAQARHNDFRVRQAHELNGLLALAEQQFDRSLAELAQANQQDPVVLYAEARAYRGKGDVAKAQAMTTQVVGMYPLPTLSFVLIRAKAGAGT